MPYHGIPPSDVGAICPYSGKMHTPKTPISNLSDHFEPILQSGQRIGRSSVAIVGDSHGCVRSSPSKPHFRCAWFQEYIGPGLSYGVYPTPM